MNAFVGLTVFIMYALWSLIGSAGALILNVKKKKKEKKKKASRRTWQSPVLAVGVTQRHTVENTDLFNIVN